MNKRGGNPGNDIPSPSRLSPVLASALAVGLMLAVASCGQVTPLGPDPAAKVAVSNGACFAQVGTPVTITSAAISPVFSPPATSPAGQPPPPARYGFTITLSPAEVPELTAVTTTAADDQGPLALSVDGRT